ncbi:MAG: hypothetical protein RBG1_1C00001G0213 [candidate division Zixibacteria bacterium RBG-1]|nr:MAG: hypothetical protein RBG1_1C00001G0213 [candidate division Zixibacteria bacterium RBG-1]OGC83923.1 MAG: ketol-acid reductoisomerase [candidate division Zixibacteria bacterium RBG_19FT_COMBO_42_43]
MKIYRDREADLNFLRNKTIGILGYGNQGKAQALNLADSGFNAIIGLPSKSKSRKAATKDGFKVYLPEEVPRKADIICFLAPDHLHGEIFKKSIAKNLKPGQALIFAAGFSIHFKLINPPKFVDVILVAPAGPGRLMRECFLQNQGIPAFLAIEQNYSKKAQEIGLAYAKAIGCTKAFVMQTTFKDEALGDIFGEQVVLCGSLSELIKAGFETLVYNGLSPENAYMECLYQLDLIVKLLKEKGIKGMYDEISVLAGYGAGLTGKRIIDSAVKNKMQKIFSEIKSGKFAKELVKEYRSGMKKYNRIKRENQRLLIDKVAERIRKISTK